MKIFGKCEFKISDPEKFLAKKRLRVYSFSDFIFSFFFMARTISAKKNDIAFIFGIYSRPETTKVAADPAKYYDSRKALKKPIKDYLERRAEKEKEARDFILEVSKKEIEPLRKKFADEKNDEAKKEIEAEVAKKSEALNGQLAPFNEALTAMFDALETEDAEVVFQNDDFIYFSDYLKANAADLCGVKDGDKVRLDADAHERIFDFLGKAV